MFLSKKSFFYMHWIYFGKGTASNMRSNFRLNFVGLFFVAFSDCIDWSIERNWFGNFILHHFAECESCRKFTNYQFRSFVAIDSEWVLLTKKKQITIFRFSLNDDELSFAIDFFSRSSNELKKWQSTIVDVACILIEFMIIFIWPIYYSGSFQSWMISIALILISLGWWENFVSMHSKFRKLNCVFVCFSWQFAIAMLFVGFLFSNNSTFGNVQ